MNDQDIQKILTILNPVWPSSGLDKALIPAWRIAFQNQDSALLQAAAAEWIRTEKWFPRPAELIALANEIGGPRALPAPELPQRTAEGYESLLRTADLAKKYNVKLHPRAEAAIDEAREWWKGGAA